jgi:hypothetical protein
MPLRFWHRLREDGGQGSGSRPEPERQTRPSEMKVSLRTRRQTLSEPRPSTGGGVDPSGQRVVRGPSQRQQRSPRLRPEAGPGPRSGPRRREALFESHSRKHTKSPDLFRRLGRDPGIRVPRCRSLARRGVYGMSSEDAFSSLSSTLQQRTDRSRPEWIGQLRPRA